MRRNERQENKLAVQTTPHIETLKIACEIKDMETHQRIQGQKEVYSEKNKYGIGQMSLDISLYKNPCSQAL